VRWIRRPSQPSPPLQSSAQSQAFELELERTRIVVQSRRGHHVVFSRGSCAKLFPSLGRISTQPQGNRTFLHGPGEPRMVLTGFRGLAHTPDTSTK
jgi:hypothetical protein